MPVIIDGSTGITTPGVTDTGNLSVAGSTTLTTPLPVASGGTGATSLAGITVGTATTATAASSLVTTNFSIVEVGGKLYFKNGATNIASLDSSGNLIVLANVTAYGTP